MSTDHGKASENDLQLTLSQTKHSPSVGRSLKTQTFNKAYIPVIFSVYTCVTAKSLTKSRKYSCISPLQNQTK